MAPQTTINGPYYCIIDTPKDQHTVTNSEKTACSMTNVEEVLSVVEVIGIFSLYLARHLNKKQTNLKLVNIIASAYNSNGLITTHKIVYRVNAESNNVFCCYICHYWFPAESIVIFAWWAFYWICGLAELHSIAPNTVVPLTTLFLMHGWLVAWSLLQRLLQMSLTFLLLHKYITTK